MQYMWIVAVLALFAQAPADSLRAIEKLIASGQIQEALGALAQQPNSVDRQLLTSKAHDAAGDAASAVAAAEAALALDPKSEAAHLQLGQIFLSHNTPEAALEVFTDALALRPNSYLLHAGRGIALQNLVLYEEAEQELRQCLATKPGFSICFDGLATVMLHTQQYAELVQLASDHEAINPRDFRGPYFLAAAQHGMNASAETIEKHLARAIALNPRFAASYALQGRVRLDRDDVGSAIESLEVAVRLRPGYPPALLNLAQAYKRAGRVSDAEATRELLRKANDREREGKPVLIYRRGAKPSPAK